MSKSLTNLETILHTFFEHQLIIKMLHFQTKHYGAHKTLDRYGSTFRDQLDLFMEVGQGIFGTVKTKNIDISVPTMTDSNIEKYMNEFIKFLDTFEKLLGSGHSDLLNIRDEIKAESNRLKYLLKFR